MTDTGQTDMPTEGVPVTVAVDGQWFTVADATISKADNGDIVATITFPGVNADHFTTALGMPGAVGLTVGPLAATAPGAPDISINGEDVAPSGT